jgi:hypothetical protein
MKRRVMIRLATALCVCTPSSAYAHHSHPIFYDQCKKLTLEGRVESAQWKNPHVLLVLEMDDGTTYTAEWTSLDALTRTGVTGPAQAVLTPGARVVVLGDSLRDPAQIRRSFPEVNISNTSIVDVVQIRRVDGSWSWSRTSPAECTF